MNGHNVDSIFQNSNNKFDEHRINKFVLINTNSQ